MRTNLIATAFGLTGLLACDPRHVSLKADVWWPTEGYPYFALADRDTAVLSRGSREKVVSANDDESLGSFDLGLYEGVTDATHGWAAVISGGPPYYSHLVDVLADDHPHTDFALALEPLRARLFGTDRLVVTSTDFASRCEVALLGGERADVPVEAAACGAWEAIAAAGEARAFVGGARVWDVRPTGAVPFSDIPAHTLAWDTENDLLYAAADGGSTVTALTSDGRVLWETDVDGQVRALDDFGARGGAVVSVERDDLVGVLLILDPSDGAIRTSRAYPVATPWLAVSHDGDRIGWILDRDIYFFRVRSTL